MAWAGASKELVWLKWTSPIALQAEAAWSLAVQEEGVQPKRMSGRQTVPRRHGSKSKYRRQAQPHRGRAGGQRGGRAGRTTAGQPTSREGALLRLARLSGIRAGASLHERWGDGAFLSGSRCLAAARGCQPRELAWEEVPVGVVIARISCRWRPSRRTEWKVGRWVRIGARDLRGQKGRKDSNGGEDPDAPDTSQATSGSYRDPHKGPHAQNPSFGFKNSEELLHWPIPSGSDLEHVRGEAWPFTAYGQIPTLENHFAEGAIVQRWGNPKEEGWRWEPSQQMWRPEGPLHLNVYRKDC
ncbi:uncharacterized protein LOC125965580 [Orcinus orca]|uniref:uncharacterized protein LOC125965580 n=1 Tax=Orcinus orca TaxID=9733 RepID=UPI002111B666|nr:uncharacterized protein LOC125965580 [Orcinus orca]